MAAQSGTERYAAGYGSHAGKYADVLDPTLASVASRIVALAQPTEKSEVLDLATGTGAVARLAAATGAKVVGIDISPGMVDLARSLSAEHIRFEVADAVSLPFESGRFDVVTCGFGLSHVPDVQGTLVELLRVLRPGGHLVESSWGNEAQNAAFSAALTTLKAYAEGQVHAFADIRDEGTWADPSRGSQILERAGSDRVTVRTEKVSGSYRNAQQALKWMLAWPDYGLTVSAFVPQRREKFEASALAAIEQAHDLSWWFAINYYVAAKPS